MIKYLGSKRRLIEHIRACVRALPDVTTVLDLFSGTSRVGHALKGDGYDVIANDHNMFAHVFARCYVAADRDAVEAEVHARLRELEAAEPYRGYFTRTFCEEARFVHPKNGRRIDGMRRAIRDMALAPEIEAVLLTSLVEAADRVDSTTGVQMAYLKKWAPRALGDIQLRMPALLPGSGRALRMDAAAAAAAVEADVAYLDPPYNQHSYLSNYHVWETLVRDDAPEAYGIARKRTDCKERKSPFNSKRQIYAALERVLDALRVRHLIVSFNDEGYVTPQAMTRLLSRFGGVVVFSIAQNRYVGAKIGIHDPKGRRVGRVGRLRNRELLYVVSPDIDALMSVHAALHAV